METNTIKTFVGFDLGDGESITDFVRMDTSNVRYECKTEFEDMTMPDSNIAGRAIPTTYGHDENGNLVFAQSILMMPDLIKDIQINFKRRPCDLLPNISSERAMELKSILNEKNIWPSRKECPELYTPEMEKFREAVVTFTNAVFEDPIYMKKVSSASTDSSELLFCVGHPTRWNDLDVAIYKSIHKSSILGKGSYAGKNSSLILAAESRAAFLTIKDKASENVLPKGTSALLIDVGSSTIDLTAVSSDSHNYQYNCGSNYLGVRSIDFIIREMYFEKIRETSDGWDEFQKIIGKNPTQNEALLLACRMAKENMYSTTVGAGQIVFPGFSAETIKQEDVDHAINKSPIAPILAREISLPDEHIYEMNKKTWKELFFDFLTEQKEEISKKGIKVGRIILTGSASKMPFVEQIVKDVFNDLSEDNILFDMDPSRSISKGLALVGPFNEKSLKFQKDVQNLIDEELPKIIEQDIPYLADDLSNVLNHIISDIIKKNLRLWRESKIDTLDAMEKKVKSECELDQLQSLLLDNADYIDTIRIWSEDIVGQDIAVKLQDICQRYGVRNLALQDLNVMKVPEINDFNLNVDVIDFSDTIIVIVSVIAGIIAAVVLPFVLGIIIGLISWISIGIASFLLSVLLAIPGPGYLLLAGLAGYAVIKAAIGGLDSAKDDLMIKLKKSNLPEWVRKRLTDEKIDREVAKANLKGKIRSAILEDESVKSIVESVSQNLSTQIENRAEDVKYVIESK